MKHGYVPLSLAALIEGLGVPLLLAPVVPLGYLMPGDPLPNGQTLPTTIAPTPMDDFSPSLGIAYSPNWSDGWLRKLAGGPGKTSIRMGAGQRTAGTRTTALVAAGASAFVMAGLLLDGDPSGRGRIASYVVSGVGFRGADVISKDSGNVRGLNTAATIWCSAAIGGVTRLSAPPFALILAVGVIFTNTVLRLLAYRLHPV